jgi:hypothetical protein
MFYTLAEAAKATGSSRAAILAAIEGGRITAVKDLFGQWQIERGELHRLHHTAEDGPGNEADLPYPASSATSLEAELQALVSAAGDGLRQPYHDAGCDQGALYSAEQTPPLHHADLWSPPSSDASESIRSPSEPTEHAEFSGTVGRESPDPQQAFREKFPPIDQLAIAFPEPVPEWNHEIRIGDGDKILGPTSPGRAGRRRAVMIGGVIAGALGLGWIAGSGAHVCFDRAAPAPLHSSAPGSGTENRPEGPETGRDPSSAAANIRKIAIPPAAKRAIETLAQTATAATKPVPSQPQHTGSSSKSPATVQQQAKLEPPRTPTPETRPTTIDGWTVREVVGGTAVLEGPNGVVRVSRGDTLPGVGRVYSIVRWGNRWIVATGSGLISTP